MYNTVMFQKIGNADALGGKFCYFLVLHTNFPVADDNKITQKFCYFLVTKK